MGEVLTMHASRTRLPYLMYASALSLYWCGRDDAYAQNMLSDTPEITIPTQDIDNTLEATHLSLKLSPVCMSRRFESCGHLDVQSMHRILERTREPPDMVLLRIALSCPLEQNYSVIIVHGRLPKAMYTILTMLGGGPTIPPAPTADR